MLMKNADGEMVGHSGLTVREWEDRRIADYLAGRCETPHRKWDFEREFLADEDGFLDGIEKIQNQVTGEWVTLDPPIRVHVDEIDQVINQYQAKFLAEWEAGAFERAKRDGR